MMAIEDTVGYRFVRISLVLLNCLVLVRLVSLLLQYSHVFEPTFVLFVLLIGSNFMAAIIGAIREHRISVMITGSITLIMFLSLIFTAKENKSVNVSLLTLLAIAVQSLIFSEMLKERQTLISQRRGVDYISSSNSRNNATSATPSSGGPLAAVVVYQTSGSTRGHPGSLFMIDPVLGTELPKDAPPSYFSSNCPPPKYEDAIKLNASEQSLPIVPATIELSTNDVTQNQASNYSESTATNPVSAVPAIETVQSESPLSSNSPNTSSSSSSVSQDNANLDKSTPLSQPPPYSNN